MLADDKRSTDFSDVQGGASSTAPRSDTSERTYTVIKGDSLSKISERFYGNAGKWRTIYEVNKAVIGDNPDLIKPGQILVIPEA